MKSVETIGSHQNSVIYHVVFAVLGANVERFCFRYLLATYQASYRAVSPEAGGTLTS